MASIMQEQRAEAGDDDLARALALSRSPAAESDDDELAAVLRMSLLDAAPTTAATAAATIAFAAARQAQDDASLALVLQIQEEDNAHFERQESKRLHAARSAASRHHSVRVVSRHDLAAMDDVVVAGASRRCDDDVDGVATEAADSAAAMKHMLEAEGISLSRPDGARLRGGVIGCRADGSPVTKHDAALDARFKARSLVHSLENSGDLDDARVPARVYNQLLQAQAKQRTPHKGDGDLKKSPQSGPGRGFPIATTSRDASDVFGRLRHERVLGDGPLRQIAEGNEARIYLAAPPIPPLSLEASLEAASEPLSPASLGDDDDEWVDYDSDGGGRGAFVRGGSLADARRCAALCTGGIVLKVFSLGRHERCANVEWLGSDHRFSEQSRTFSDEALAPDDAPSSAERRTRQAPRFRLRGDAAAAAAAEVEFRNLRRAFRADRTLVPRPVLQREGVVVMQFVDGVRLDRVKDLSQQGWKSAFGAAASALRSLYREAKLVHNRLDGGYNAMLTANGPGFRVVFFDLSTATVATRSDLVKNDAPALHHVFSSRVECSLQAFVDFATG
eukprot:CAMPEP_0184096240 /NCGR_PEP_ID=MMETSP0974-20121125/10182_1 /TAXON_ID=483370 /ORGANISM="non described non described, Strain CCMP2097" /LENGTH=561 /DNA_ID=CAMNT_0026399065 /DNA_START=20 /DNA_END=1701 /DNA_ORIENTATION=-